ncbi:hypothetical protein FRC16_000755 [Serendipita sp. 398]|nr:hypothetical protein FRC16_000755 [Serendipita sp. 398]
MSPPGSARTWPLMPPTFKLHKDHEKIEAQRAKGILIGTFKCKRCGYLGYSTNGGESKHLARNQYCRSLDVDQEYEPMEIGMERDQYANEDENVPLVQEIPDVEDMVENYARIADRKVHEQNSGETGTMADEENAPQPVLRRIVSKEPPPFNLPIGQIYIQQHPFAGEHIPSLNTSPLRTQRTYWPFETLGDFEQAEIFDQSEASIKAINAQLNLIQRVQGPDRSITLRNATDLRNTLEKAMLLDEDRFHHRLITTKWNDHTYQHVLYYRDIMGIIRDVLSDPNLSEHLIFDAEKRFIQQSNGEENDRVYQEYYQCDDFWDLQTAIGEQLGRDVNPLALFIYSDETQLTSFGNNTIWSVYLWVGNLPHHIRASFGPGGAVLLGYLPKGDKQDDLRDSELGDYRSSLYHECFRVMLKPLKQASQIGDLFRMGNGDVRTLVPVISVKLGDYPELCRMNGIISKDCDAACPAGMIPTEDFDKTNIICPPRDHDLERAAIYKSLGLGHDDNDDDIPTPQSLGLRPIKNAFDRYTNTYFATYRTVGADGLHWVKQGVFGRVWFKKLLEKLTGPEKKQLNKCFKNLPRYPNLPGFAQGVTSLKWRSGSDHAVLSKTIVPILDCIYDSKTAVQNNIIRLFRLFSECMLLVGFQAHTDTTLSILQTVLREISELQEQIASIWGINLARPKVHFMFLHLIDSIKSKGPVCNTDTGMGEARHPESKHAYARTNHHTETVKEQMIRHVVNREIIRKIRAKVDREGERVLSNRSISIPGGDIGLEQLDPGSHVHLGSPDRSQHLSSYIEALATTHSLNHRDILKKLQGYIRHFARDLIPSDRDSDDGGNGFDISYLKVVNHKKADIGYISLEDHQPLRDIIRVNASWRGRAPRYDHIVVNRDHRALSCAQVLALFTIRVKGTSHSVVLIRPLQIKPRSKRHRFYTCTPSNDATFIHPGSIVRSVYVQKNATKPERMFINDVIDADMFLRLRNSRLVSY